jgi:hypothetical protein
MKESKKVILGVIKKHLEKNDKIESQVLNLAIKKLDGAKEDEHGVCYSKGGKHLVMATKTLEGDYAVKEGTLEIDDNAFWGCAFVRSVTVPPTVEKIGNEAFARCLSLERVNISESVNEIGSNPFVGLDSLAVTCESASFTIDAKVLYTADRTKLISCLTDAAMVIVPKTVQTIGDLAFSRRKKLRKIQFPDGLEHIGHDAFSDCDTLEEVVIPATVQAIDTYAFSGCESLKKVTFLGTVKHLSRTAFSDDNALLSINVPAGTANKFRKQLHIAADSETLVLEHPATDAKKDETEAPDTDNSKDDNKK